MVERVLTTNRGITIKTGDVYSAGQPLNGFPGPLPEAPGRMPMNYSTGRTTVEVLSLLYVLYSRADLAPAIWAWSLLSQ